jgi:hypothetical protein
VCARFVFRLSSFALIYSLIYTVTVTVTVTVTIIMTVALTIAFWCESTPADADVAQIRCAPIDYVCRVRPRQR